MIDFKITDERDNMTHYKIQRIKVPPKTARPVGFCFVKSLSNTNYQLLYRYEQKHCFTAFRRYLFKIGGIGIRVSGTFISIHPSSALKMKRQGWLSSINFSIVLCCVGSLT